MLAFVLFDLAFQD